MKIPLRRLSSFTLAALLLLGSILGLVSVEQGNAISADQWRAGRIMDNSVFRNKNAMNVTAIQNFLNSKVPECDSDGSEPSEYGGGTRAQFGGANGAPAPYTCLKSYRENNKSSAQIIWDMAQQYGINPQVLIALLQKEQNLVTDEWPWPVQYRTAAGYGCPDTAPCDSQYYGLTNQLKWASRMFQAIIDNDPDWFTPYTTGHQFIKWSPNNSCGGTTITVENNGTSALYNYTPYQPNQAALSNLYGTGDNCSAYGNRNFWRLFHDWFGSTTEARSFTDLPEAQRRIETLEHNGKLYLFYYDAFRAALRMAVHDSSGWTFSVLDGTSATGGDGRKDGSMGSHITVTTLGDSIQLFYYDKTRGNLRHGWTDPNGWNFENFDGDSGSIGKLDGDIGIAPSAKVINGSIQLFYYDKTRGNLRHSWNDVGGWHFENLDGDRGAVSRQSSDAGAMSTLTQIGDSIQLFYYDMSTGNLRHSWSDANGWHFENLDGDRGAVARREANVGHGVIASNYGGNLRLFYYDQTSGNLRHGWTDNTGWHFENLDGDRGAVGKMNSDVGLNPSITMQGDSIQLYYYDRSNGNLRHAWTDPGGWKFENMDGDRGSIGKRDGNIGINSGTMMFGSSLQLYYLDRTNGNLRHAWTDANGWHFEDLGPTVVY